MSRRYSEPVAVQIRRDGQSLAFTWRGTCDRVRVIGRWTLATRWWEPDRHSDRTYYRVETADHQNFELYHDAAQHGGWVLDVRQD
ncbi:MAG TPA: DUF6504 family protein [Ktedonobacterales bacterium]